MVKGQGYGRRGDGIHVFSHYHPRQSWCYYWAASHATDGVAWSVCVCVCLSFGHVREPTKTAEPIDIQIRGQTQVDPRNLPCVCDSSLFTDRHIAR